MSPSVLAFGVEDDAVAVFQGQTEFERVDRVEAETLVEEWSGGVDVVRLQALQVQGLDDELFDVVDEWIHDRSMKGGRKVWRSGAR